MTVHDRFGRVLSAGVPTLLRPYVTMRSSSSLSESFVKLVMLSESAYCVQPSPAQDLTLTTQGHVQLPIERLQMHDESRNLFLHMQTPLARLRLCLHFSKPIQVVFVLGLREISIPGMYHAQLGVAF